MYIDFQKYNYSLEKENERPEYEQRGSITVDLTEEFVDKIVELGVVKADLIFAQIKSDIDNLGQSGIWHFIDIHKP